MGERGRARPAPDELAVRRMIGLAGAVRDRYGAAVGTLDLGGGFAAPYRPGDAEFDLAGLATRVRVALGRSATADRRRPGRRDVAAGPPEDRGRPAAPRPGPGY